MSKLTKGNSEQCKSRGGIFFWGAIALITVLILFSLANGHTPDGKERLASCWGDGPSFHSGVASWWCKAGDRFLDDLDLSDGQRSRVKAIVDRTSDQMEAFRDSHRDLRARLVKALEAETVRAEELTPIRTAYLELLDQASAEMLHGVVELAGVLTPDQRAALLEQGSEHRHEH